MAAERDARLSLPLAAPGAANRESHALLEHLERLERRAGRLLAVARAQHAIAAAGSPPALHAELHRSVASVIDAPSLWLFVVDTARGALAPAYIVRDGRQVAAAAYDTAPHDEVALAEALAARSPMIVARGASAVLSTPILHGDRVLGALQLLSRAGGGYDADDMELVTLLARQTGIAMTRTSPDGAGHRTREIAEHEHVRLRTLATALEALEQPVFICSTRSRIQHANGAAIREFGYSLHELTGMHERALGIRAPEHPDVADAHAAMAARGAWSGEMLQRRKDGTEFHAWVTMSAIRDDAGRQIGVVVTVRDLTEEQRIAEQLRETEKLVAVGELVAGVAHEVNNPLTGISAFAQLLQADDLTDEQREAAQIIKREADRAVTVVRDLLTFARKSGPRYVTVNCNALVEQMLRLRTYALRTADIRVARHLAPDLHLVHGDDKQLQQVLLNLIVNAEHALAGAHDRRLLIRTSNTVDRVVIEISDSGVGMTPEIQKRIFEPFFTTKGDGNGTGLGLSVSYGIVRSHGGTLTVQSAPGCGSTFRISLPRPATIVEER